MCLRGDDVLFDIQIVYNLLLIEKKIYYSLKKIFGYKRKNEVDLFSSELEILKKVLLKKENILLDKIPHSISVLEQIYEFIYSKHDFMFDNDVERFAIMSRIDNIFHNLLSDILFSDDFLYEIDDNEISVDIMPIKNNIDMMFIDYLNLLSYIDAAGDVNCVNLNDRMMAIYCSKVISDNFIYNNFNDDNLKILSDRELKTKFNVPFYEKLKNNVYFSELQDSLAELFSCDDELSSYHILRFKFLLKNVSNDVVIMIKEIIDDFFDMYSDDDIFVSLNEVISSECYDRKIMINNFEHNVQCERVDMDTSYCLSKLIKLESTIYDLFFSLSVDTVNDSFFNELVSLINYEDSLVKSLDINSNNFQVIKERIIGGIEIFSNDYNLPFNKKNLIIFRLLNIIPYFYYENMQPQQSLKSYESINNNHQICTVNNYVSFIDNYNDIVRDQLFFVLKSYIFVKSSLFKDYVYSNGNYHMVGFSDQLSSIMCDIDETEYKYDKNEQLFGVIMNILNTIKSDGASVPSFETDLLVLSEFESAVSNLDNEYINQVYGLLSGMEHSDMILAMISIVEKVKYTKNKRL